MTLTYYNRRHVASLQNALGAACVRSRNIHLALANAYGALAIIEMGHGPQAKAA